MDAARRLLLQPAAPHQHLRPFISTQGGKRSLHFSIHEIQSCVDLAEPEQLELQYTRLMAAFLLLQPSPRAIALVGLGGGALARFCRRVAPRARVAVAEINPHVIALRQQFGVPADDERFVVVPADGAAFVRRLDARADVLLVDGYTAEGLPRTLSSQRFFDDAATALGEGGVFVMNLLTDERRRIQVEERIRRSFDGLTWTVADAEGINRIVFAVRSAAQACGSHGAAPRPGPMRRPAALGAAEWSRLQVDFARVLGAWKECFA